MNVRFHIAQNLEELGSITLQAIQGPVVAVSGGATYESLFRFWHGPKVRDCLWMPVDERCVGLSEEGSNWMATIRLLLDPNGLSEQATHWSLLPQGLADLAIDLTGEGPAGVPVLDQIWLGMAPDGSTAAIYPGTPEMDDLRSIALATYAPTPPHHHISLGLGTIRAARDLCLVMTGVPKGLTLRRALDGDHSLPITRALEGLDVSLFLDKYCAEAAGL